MTDHDDLTSPDQINALCALLANTPHSSLTGEALRTIRSLVAERDEARAEYLAERTARMEANSREGALALHRDGLVERLDELVAERDRLRSTLDDLAHAPRTPLEEWQAARIKELTLDGLAQIGRLEKAEAERDAAHALLRGVRDWLTDDLLNEWRYIEGSLHGRNFYADRDGHVARIDALLAGKEPTP